MFQGKIVRISHDGPRSSLHSLRWQLIPFSETCRGATLIFQIDLCACKLQVWEGGIISTERTSSRCGAGTQFCRAQTSCKVLSHHLWQGINKGCFCMPNTGHWNDPYYTCHMKQISKAGWKAHFLKHGLNAFKVCNLHLCCPTIDKTWCNSCRRRRLIEMLGLLGSEGESEEGLSKEDHSDIEQLLMTSLDDEGRNRWTLFCTMQHISWSFRCRAKLVGAL